MQGTRLGDEKRVRILEWIRTYIHDQGCSPTLREIQEGIGDSSPAPVQHHLRILRTMGQVDWRDGCSRTIRVVAAEESC